MNIRNPHIRNPNIRYMNVRNRHAGHMDAGYARYARNSEVGGDIRDVEAEARVETDSYGERVESDPDRDGIEDRHRNGRREIHTGRRPGFALPIGIVVEHADAAIVEGMSGRGEHQRQERNPCGHRGGVAPPTTRHDWLVERLI